MKPPQDSEFTPVDADKLAAMFSTLEIGLTSENKDDHESISSRPIKQIKRLKPLKKQPTPELELPSKPPQLLTLHMLPPVHIAPTEDSPIESITNIEERLAKSFEFSRQDKDHALATIFYQLESQCQSTEWKYITTLNLSRQYLSHLDHLDTCFPFLELLDM